MAFKSVKPGSGTPDSLTIAVVVFSYPSLSETFIALQIDQLLRLGHRVVVVTIGPRGKPAFLPRSLQKNYARLTIVHSPYAVHKSARVKKLMLLRSAGVNLIRTPLATARLLKSTLQTGNRKQCLQILTDAYQFNLLPEVDIIHCQFLTIAARFEKLLAYGFIRKKQKLLAVSARGYDISTDAYRNNYNWKALFQAFDLFLPVCNFYASSLRELGCVKPIKVLPSPVNTPELQTYSSAIRFADPMQIRILSVGRLVEKKGFDVALEALARLVHLQKIVHFHYTILGGGPLLEELELLAQAKQISEFVTFCGPKPGSETLSYYAGADIFLAPSKKGRDGNSEGIPNVIKEALALGLPVVATTHAGIPELIVNGENGYLVPENDSAALAGVLARLIENAELRTTVSGKSTQHIFENFSPEKTTADLIHFYQNCIVARPI